MNNRLSDLAKKAAAIVTIAISSITGKDAMSQNLESSLNESDNDLEYNQNKYSKRKPMPVLKVHSLNFNDGEFVANHSSHSSHRSHSSHYSSR